MTAPVTALRRRSAPGRGRRLAAERSDTLTDTRLLLERSPAVLLLDGVACNEGGAYEGGESSDGTYGRKGDGSQQRRRNGIHPKDDAHPDPNSGFENPSTFARLGVRAATNRHDRRQEVSDGASCRKWFCCSGSPVFPSYCSYAVTYAGD